MNEFIKVFIYQLLINPLTYIVLFTIIFVYAYRSEIIGWMGENNTKDALKKLPKDKYKTLNNILIYTNGNTHQIDHVIVSSYGIFCIETKQWNGLILGNKYDKNWIKYMGKNKYICENPIRQNYGHVKSLCELLNMDEDKIYNIVCIPSGAKVRVKDDGEVTRYNTIVNKILSYKEVVIDNVDQVVDIINRNNIKDKQIKKEHIKNIKNKYGR